MTFNSNFSSSPNFIYGKASFQDDVFIAKNLFVSGNIFSANNTGSFSSDIVNNTRFYSNSAVDPTFPPPNTADRYYNTSLNMEMIYDGSRSKWLSNETIKYDFGRNGNTAPGSFFKDINQITFTFFKGYLMPFNGTIISLLFSQDNDVSINIDIVSNGNILNTFSGSNTGIYNDLNINFSQGDIISFRNKNDSNIIVNIIGSVRIKWRV